MQRIDAEQMRDVNIKNNNNKNKNNSSSNVNYNNNFSNDVNNHNNDNVNKTTTMLTTGERLTSSRLARSRRRYRRVDGISLSWARRKEHRYGETRRKCIHNNMALWSKDAGNSHLDRLSSCLKKDLPNGAQKSR